MGSYNVAKHIKNTATAILVFGIIAAIILVIIAITSESWVPVGTAIAVLALSVWQRMLLYGFGELIDQTAIIAKNTGSMVDFMNNKSTVNALDEELPEI